MPTQGNQNLIIVDDQPSVTNLWNGRRRLEFFCDHSSKKTSWHEGNITNILPAYGIALGDKFGVGEWSSDAGYDDLLLTEAELEFVPSASTHYVKLTYETLTATLVAEVDDKLIEGENGLKITERVLIAKAGVSFTGVVGTSTYEGKTLIKYEVENTDAYTRVTARYSESGVISRSTDLVGSQQAVVITSIGEDPITPSGYVLAKTDVNNEEGFQSTSYTFLLDGVTLSESFDYVGSQLAIVKEVFNTIPSTPSGYVIASTQESDVDGIETVRYTFLKDAILCLFSYSQLKVPIVDVCPVITRTISDCSATVLRDIHCTTDDMSRFTTLLTPDFTSESVFSTRLIDVVFSGYTLSKASLPQYWINKRFNFRSFVFTEVSSIASLWTLIPTIHRIF